MQYSKNIEKNIFSTHIDQKEYLDAMPNKLTQIVESSMDKKNPCREFSKIKKCDSITDETKKLMISTLATFYDLYEQAHLSNDPLLKNDPNTPPASQNMDNLKKICIKNIIQLNKLILYYDCQIEFTDEEIEYLLAILYKIDNRYYNILTIYVYTIIFKYLNKKFKGGDKGLYTNNMLKYLKKVKIFFYDSFIFNKNYLTYASEGLSVIDLGNNPNYIYPIQLGELGLEENFHSYFLYAHYVFDLTLSLTAAMIENPFDAKTMNSFVNIFNFAMENYVFIDDNRMVAQKFNDKSHVLDKNYTIYKMHNMTFPEANQILALVIVFISEIQFLFYGSKNDFKCQKISATICDLFETKHEICRNYMYSYHSDNINHYFGDSDQDLIKYYEQNYKKSESLKGQDNKFVESMQILKKNDSAFTEKMCRTLRYLKAVNNNDILGKKCIESINDFIKILEYGLNRKGLIGVDCRDNSNKLSDKLSDKSLEPYQNISFWEEPNSPYQNNPIVNSQ